MRQHHLLDVKGVRIHAVEEGAGPLVLLLHGFPELWYSWRYQLPALAQAGYRAIAIDQRGYGLSSKFWKPDAYRIHQLVSDVTGVVAALGETRAVVVGHDWGAPIAWTAAWLHPEIFRGVCGISVPFSGRGVIALPGSPFGERRPDDLHREIPAPGEDFYQTYFGEMGAIIDEIETDVRGWLRDVVWSMSGEALAGSGIDFSSVDPLAMTRGSPLCIARGTRMRDRFQTPAAMPAWFTDADLQYFTEAFQRSGFGGPLSYYRNLDADWHDLESQADEPLMAPAMFLGGEFDIGTLWGRTAIARALERIPNYLGTQILAGCGHWIQQERPAQTNAALIEFLQQLD